MKELRLRILTDIHVNDEFPRKFTEAKTENTRAENKVFSESGVRIGRGIRLADDSSNMKESLGGPNGTKLRNFNKRGGNKTGWYYR